ncbi:DUF7115 domain-containing protein [Natrononativus amylolyticus]|uniref:DUF7115 domain-containing protein n=1 Tax=Natrononativus amylolyticus TaxID=2963434 RepID=UPI0020CF3CFD|nr:hypothetical protein [Natrononativus amylolyticus]
MNVPGIVQSTLDGEEISAQVSLGGEDELYVTPTKSVIYRADGLLSDESVETYPHDADRLTLSEGRRKTRFSLEYALGDTDEFAIPARKTEAALHPVLAGVLSGNGITDPGETVVQTYRFSELTVIVTSQRLLKHVGEAVWDGDFEGYHFDDVTKLSFEDGAVATQVVLEVDGRQQRIKAPNDQAGDLSERLKRALFAYYDVDSLAALNERIGVEEAEDPQDDPAAAFGEGVDPLDADPPAPEDGATASDRDAERATSVGETRPSSAAAVAPAHTPDREGESAAAESETETRPAEDGFEHSEFTPATSDSDAELAARLEALEATVERQTELLERQQRTIEQLIEELRQGR